MFQFVAGIAPVPGGFMRAQAKTYKTTSDLTSKMSANAGVSHKLGMFSGSSSYTALSQQITKHFKARVFLTHDFQSIGVNDLNRRSFNMVETNFFLARNALIFRDLSRHCIFFGFLERILEVLGL